MRIHEDGWKEKLKLGLQRLGGSVFFYVEMVDIVVRVVDDGGVGWS